MAIEYYYLLMSQQDLLQNEVIEEVIRERASSYILQSKRIDFWISINPKFIKDMNLSNKIAQTNFYKQKQSTLSAFNNKTEFYGAVISTNKEFITWLSLRLGYFEDLDLLNKSSSNNQDYVSNGVIGKTEVNSLNNQFSLKEDINNIHPNILTNKYQKLLEVMYTYKK